MARLGHLPFRCHFVPFISGPHSRQNCIALLGMSLSLRDPSSSPDPRLVPASCARLGCRCPGERAPRRIPRAVTRSLRLLCNCGPTRF